MTRRTLVAAARSLSLLACAAIMCVAVRAQSSTKTADSNSDAAHYGKPDSKTTSASAGVKLAAAPKVGERAPDFRLPYATQENIFMKPEEQMTLASQRGKNVILAFYPADWSGGCTKEVCTLRDTFAELSKLNATVLAVSGDYVFSHQEWAKHHNLQFPLLSDHDHAVAKTYDSYMEGVGFNKRTVYLIDKDGVVRYVNLAFKAGDKKDYDALRAELEKLK
jgi:peroxiredoxin